MPRVLPGNYELIERGAELVKGRKYALLTHQAAVTDDLWPLADRLIDEPGCAPSLIFAPEHGMGGQAQDMESVGHFEYRGVPGVSLYGETADSLRPQTADLKGLEAVVIDLADVGARYYTYAVTACYMIEACAEAGAPVIVCDRPNPLGGVRVEGPLPDENFRSFVGRFDVCVMHGMTLGELLNYTATREGVDVDMTILQARGYRRTMDQRRIDPPFASPSPNMPTLSTAMVYPGGCLLEATNLSEGRGTTTPFEAFGAPFLDGIQLAEALNDLKLVGCVFRPIRFVPQFQKHAGRLCEGCFQHVTHPLAHRPFLTGLAVVKTCRDLAGDAFSWRQEPYEFVADIPALDLLTGSADLREMIEQGASIDEMAEYYAPDEKLFIEQRESYLLYR